MRKLLCSLAGKLALIQTVFLILALAAIAMTLWVSWQLEGGAGAINEAGRLRMLAYRLTLSQQAGELAQVGRGVQEFDAMVIKLRDGDPSRPLFVPDNSRCREHLLRVQQAWPVLRTELLQNSPSPTLRAQTDTFVATVDQLVTGIESTIAARTALLGGLCFGLVLLVVGASVVFVSGTLVWIVQPLQRLRDGLRTMAARDFSVRINERNSVDEFSSLADGFNQMADALERSYKGLELKVAEKTASLAQQNERLAALYDVALMGNRGNDSLETLSQAFAQKIAQIAGADAAAVRLAAEDGVRLLLMGHARLPRAMLEAERCVRVGACACGDPLQTAAGALVIPIRSLKHSSLGHCEQAGYQTMVLVTMRTPQRRVGEVELFFYGEHEVSESDRQLFDALVGNFAAQIDNLRLAARDREMAVSEERNLLAQELHDSIAQSLAFLKIQVQLLHKAMDRKNSQDMQRTVGEIDTGVRECYADVRELLLHFRTRPGHEDIEHALRVTLSKFELQSGLSTRLDVSGHGVPLPPDQQLQILHVVQEALSNVRKHAKAHHVDLRVQQEPNWQFEVSDDGTGFDQVHAHVDATHVGLTIMRERAQRIGATLQVSRRTGGGTQVTLRLPPTLVHAEQDAHVEHSEHRSVPALAQR